MEKTVFIVYTGDTILLGPDKDEIDLLVKRLGKSFKIEDQGDLSDYRTAAKGSYVTCNAVIFSPKWYETITHNGRR
jgi:hypothetical protein